MRIIDENGLALKKFYKSDLGKVFGWLIRRRISKIWIPETINPNERILYCGFNDPFLDLFDGSLDNTDQLVNFTPYSNSQSGDVIIAPEKLPVRNAQFNRIISAHIIENVDSAEDLLSEFWRILEPEGRLILVVINKHGFWRNHAISGDQAFSANEIHDLLRASKFKLHSFSRTVHFPPTGSLTVARILNTICKIMPSKSGVMIFEAEKRLYAPRGRTIKIVPTLREIISGTKRPVNTKDIAN